MVVFLLPVGLSSAEPTVKTEAHAQTVRAVVENPVQADALSDGEAHDRKLVMETFPALDLDMMIRFYNEYAGDLLEDWRKMAGENAKGSAENLRRMARHFLQLEEIRLSDRQEYDRLLEYEVLQKQMRLLGKEVKRLKAIDVNTLDDIQKATLAANIEKGEEKLRNMLELAFDESLRQQLYEIDKLDLEIERLRQKVDERRLRRQQTIQQRFRVLTEGGAMP